MYPLSLMFDTTAPSAIFEPSTPPVNDAFCRIVAPSIVNGSDVLITNIVPLEILFTTVPILDP